ncbi:ParB N-terminal domain-containing protein [Patescibacteria group bacterium]|nr:ParB N-terminal domain-containing protein [Patescibacteria group bacterium]MBU2633372.1 ParB N-terminal domain-containing protein [Patescibacteria group bacterium]
MNFQLKIIEISSLLPHEEIDLDHFPKLLEEVKKNKFVVPVVADKKTLVILDGHHRFTIMKTLGFKVMPAYLVNYNDTNIKVTPRRKEYVVTKKEIIQRGLTGNLYPYKTTKHIINNLKKQKISFDLLAKK